MEEIKMSAEERSEFEAFKLEKAKKAEAEKVKQDREAYKELVDETVRSVFPGLQITSQQLADKKADVYEKFQSVISLKEEIYKNKSDNKSHTFTDSKGTFRITLGRYEIDAYDDTVNEGIAKVKDYIASLAKDNESRMLVNGIMKLLAKDQKGNLKASRVMQLRKMAEESRNENFIDGVRIIEAAYRPEVSKQYVKAERKAENGAWVNVPLGMTEV